MSTTHRADRVYSPARIARVCVLALFAASALLAVPAFAGGAPEFEATVIGVSQGTHRVSITWRIAPADSPLVLHAYRMDQADVGFFTRRLVSSSVPNVTFEDTTVIAGHTYWYHLAAEENGHEYPSGMTTIAAPDEPVLRSLDLFPLAVMLTWAPSAAADSYQVWRARDAGAFEQIANFAATRTEFSFIDYSFAPRTEDLLTYQLRWHEADGLWRAMRDTTVHLAELRPPPASFAIAGANPAREGFALSYALPDARPARVGVYDVTGRLRLSREVAGVGRHTWLVPAGALSPSIYFARFEHPALSRTIRVVVLR